jgi:NAD(P)-dependent dehydrogenase (short-subunit alcohol dehydrogenase family)
LEGRAALVTGASQGIGRATAEALAACGADVVINHFDPDAEEAEKAADRVRKLGRRAWVVKSDVSDEEQVKRMFSDFRAQCGKLDIVVNNAGTAQPRDIFDLSLADWRRLLDINLTGCFLVSQQAMLLMREQGTGGRIVNMSSMVAHQGALYGSVHYAASKSGLLGFTKTLARTGAPLGITVNAVAPGIVETPLLFKTHGEEGVRKLAATVPLGLGKPEDVGWAVAFLCSDAARYITGATLDVNGGIYFR